MSRILFVASEAFPFAKTGGLGDVCGSLPGALKKLGADVRLLMPGYRDTLAVAGRLKTIARLSLPGASSEATLLEGHLPGNVPAWLLDYPAAFDRPGNPYLDARGNPWPDNAERFALLNHAAVAIALGRTAIKWLPDLVHCHDWQAGLVPALLAQEPRRPTTLFTIHNLAYQGLFPYATFAALGLPPALWSYQALEFHGQMSFIKGGLVYADWITTVSPTYAREIQTPAFGCGLDGLLQHRSQHLLGILNGIDEKDWNPARDPHLVAPYSARRLAPKSENKAALQAHYRLPRENEVPLIGMVGRLVEQKGIDQVLAALPALMQERAQLVVLGSGESAIEQTLREQAARYPGRLGVQIGYDEALAHRIEAGADLFLMPSRFEPCGLNQLYSLRYGTVPIVRRVGGLADTVVDTSEENLSAGAATGIVFDGNRTKDLLGAVQRALALYRTRRRFRRVMLAGMRQNFSWRHSAEQYLDLYRQAQGA